MTDNSERYLISFNGEIFNYKELRNDLIKIDVILRPEVILKFVEVDT